LSLLGETETSQNTGGARFSLIRFHLGELRIDITQGDIQSFPLMIQSSSILGGIGQRRSFFFDSSQLF
jgi:hypothetical protein